MIAKRLAVCPVTVVVNPVTAVDNPPTVSVNPPTVKPKTPTATFAPSAAAFAFLILWFNADGGSPISIPKKSIDNVPSLLIWSSQ